MLITPSLVQNCSSTQSKAAAHPNCNGTWKSVNLEFGKSDDDCTLVEAISLPWAKQLINKYHFHKKLENF